jgi:hypothetical protein
MEVFTNGLNLEILFWFSFMEFILIIVLFYLVYKMSFIIMNFSRVLKGSGKNERN